MILISSFVCSVAMFAATAGDEDAYLSTARAFLSRTGFSAGLPDDLRVQRLIASQKFVEVVNGMHRVRIRCEPCMVEGLTDRRKESAFLGSREPRASFAITTADEALPRLREWRTRMGVPLTWKEMPVEHLLDRNPLYPDEKAVWGRSCIRYEEYPNGLPFLNRGNYASIWLDPGDGDLVYFSIRQVIEVQTSERRVNEEDARLTAIAAYRADRRKIFESSDYPTPLTVRYGYGVSNAEAHPAYEGTVRARLGYEFVFEDTQKTTIIVDAESGDVLYRSYA